MLEQQAGSRAGSNALKGLQQTVCPISGLIINKEESRIQDHLEGRNYKCAAGRGTCSARSMCSRRSGRGRDVGRVCGRVLLGVSRLG